MYLKKSFSRNVFLFINVFVMIFISFICIAPILHVFMASISDPTELVKKTGIILYPLGKINFEGYKIVLRNPSIISGYLNTIIYVVTGTLLSVVATSIGAYALSRKKLILRDPIMVFISITMLFNGGMIPNYMLIKYLGMYDSRLAMIIPGCISVFNLILMRTSFMSLPDSLEESAKLDGANDFTILFKIIIPLSKAVIAVVVLFTAVGIWNSWFNAMIYLRSYDKYPLQMVLRDILVQNNTAIMTATEAANDVDLYKQLVKYCTIIVSTLPILFVYPFVQKYFSKGVMVGAVKG